jgi:RNA polymerase sigma-70 factor, ECF subfamily
MEPAGGHDAAVRAGARLSSAYADPVAEELFLGHRRMLLALAYRLLGRVTEAEDVVQDAWLRWSAADRDEVANPAAFLTTVTTRLALDRLRSAAARREVYVGSWLPEPLPTGDEALPDSADPADSLVLRETASMGVLLLLDGLGPAERAVFVLREAFGLPYPEIAAVLGRTDDSCRQLLSRARRRMAGGPGRRDATGPASAPASAPADARPLVDAFLAAARGGDLGRLQALLRADIVVTSDGGGTVRAGRHPIHGAQKAARLFAKVFERFYAATEITHASYNHAPALVIRTPVRVVVYVFGCDAEGRIAEVYAVLNPDKLRHLEPASSR